MRCRSFSGPSISTRASERGFARCHPEPRRRRRISYEKREPSALRSTSGRRSRVFFSAESNFFSALSTAARDFFPQFKISFPQREKILSGLLHFINRGPTLHSLSRRTLHGRC